MRDDDPGLPIKLHPCSNGEFVPAPATDLVLEAAKRAREACNENAKRTGISRRDFLLSICGAATTLSVLAACSKDKSRATGETVGGTFTVPTEATTETTAAQAIIGGEGFVMDVQTHFLEYDETNATQTYWGNIFPQAGCGEDDQRDCFSVGHFLDLLLASSDTSVGVLSGVPIVGDEAPLSSGHMFEAMQISDRLCGNDRLVMQGHVAPNNGAPLTSVDAMEAALERWPIKAWKAYCHANGPGYFLDGSDGTDIGPRFIRKAADLGVPVIAVHKGFSNGSRFAAPIDVGPAAKDNPDVTFTIYHSGYESGGDEGEYLETTKDQGVNRLITSLRGAGIGPGSNVCAEIGSTWRAVMGSPNEAAHVLGKLLLHVGEDNILWGTDSIWYGSPQDQIQAFRAFEVTAEYQERYGYPALTKEIKAKILGLNAARVYGVNPATSTRCDLSQDEREELRLALGTNTTFGPTTRAELIAHQRAHDFVVSV